MAMIEALGGAASLTPDRTKDLGQDLGKALSSYDFLKLFVSQLENQNPLEPLSNSEMMQQISQLTNLQAVTDLASSVSDMMGQNSLLQASGLLGRSVEYADEQGKLALALIQEVLVDAQHKVLLGLSDGGQIEVDAVRRVLGV